MQLRLWISPLVSIGHIIDLHASPNWSTPLQWLLFAVWDGRSFLGDGMCWDGIKSRMGMQHCGKVAAFRKASHISGSGTTLCRYTSDVPSNLWTWTIPNLDDFGDAQLKQNPVHCTQTSTGRALSTWKIKNHGRYTPWFERHRRHNFKVRRRAWHEQITLSSFSNRRKKVKK